MSQRFTFHSIESIVQPTGATLVEACRMAAAAIDGTGDRGLMFQRVLVDGDPYPTDQFIIVTPALEYGQWMVRTVNRRGDGRLYTNNLYRIDPRQGGETVLVHNKSSRYCGHRLGQMNGKPIKVTVTPIH